MANEQWIDTKKEYDVKPDGTETLNKVTKELDVLRRKDIIDFRYRYIALAPLLLTLLLFYFQQCNESKRQKRLFELETYTNTTTNIQTITDRTRFDEELQSARADFFYKSLPKIKFINDTTIFKLADTLKGLINYYTYSLNFFDKAKLIIERNSNDSKVFDSLYQIESEVFKELSHTYTYLDPYYKNISEIKSGMSKAEQTDSELSQLNGLLKDKHPNDSIINTLTMRSQMNWSAVYMTNQFIKNKIQKRNQDLDSIMIAKIHL
jgi:hypothetical protein